jgi:tetratricopeptide (TPR) repeat protein
MTIAPRTITLIALWPILAIAEPPDLAPLLPPFTAAAEPVLQAIQSGDLARAAALVESLAPADRTLWHGILAILRNDPATAIRTLRRAGHPKALGVAYYLAHQYVLFREQMDEAIRRTPQDFGPYYFLGRHYDSELDNCAEAARWLRLALERNPSYSRARSHLGSCLERLGQLAEAEQAYRASLDVPLSQLGMARLRLAAGASQEALEYVRKALAAEPRDAAGQRLAARIYEKLDRPRDAIRALESAAQSAPYDASIHYLLYRLHRAAGEDAKAAAAMKEFERVRMIYGSQPQ